MNLSPEALSRIVPSAMIFACANRQTRSQRNVSNYLPEEVRPMRLFRHPFSRALGLEQFGAPAVPARQQRIGCRRKTHQHFLGGLARGLDKIDILFQVGITQ